MTWRLVLKDRKRILRLACRDGGHTSYPWNTLTSASPHWLAVVCPPPCSSPQLSLATPCFSCLDLAKVKNSANWTEGLIEAFGVGAPCRVSSSYWKPFHCLTLNLALISHHLTHYSGILLP
jgi:hypothetical protein